MDFTDTEIKLFDLLIKNGDLKGTSLQRVGFSRGDLRLLCHQKVLVKGPNDFYRLGDFDRLKAYGAYLESENELDLAKKCYAVCESYDKENIQKTLKGIWNVIKSGVKPTEKNLLCVENITSRQLRILYICGLIKFSHRIVEPLVGEDTSLLFEDKKEGLVLDGLDSKMESVVFDPPLSALEKKVFDIYIETGILSNRELYARMTSLEIKTAVAAGIFNQVSNYYYFLTDIDRFKNYGNMLMVEGNTSKAKECFMLCAANDPLYLRQKLYKIYDLLPQFTFLTKRILLNYGFDEITINALLAHGHIFKKEQRFFPAERENFQAYIEQLEKSGQSKEAANCRELLDGLGTEEIDVSEDRKKIYEAIANNGKIYIADLEIAGLSKNRISILIQRGFISNLGSNGVILYSYDGLFDFACELEKKGDIDKAANCFGAYLESLKRMDKQLELNVDYLEIAIRLMNYCFLKGQYKECFSYLSILKDSEDYVTTFNFYLYLFSFLFTLPENYKRMSRTFLVTEIEEFDHPSGEEAKSFLENVLKQNFIRALEIFDRKVDGEVVTASHDVLTRNLLVNIIKNNKNLMKILADAVEKRDTRTLYEILGKEYGRHKLKPGLQMILDLAADIEQYKKDGTFPLKREPHKCVLSEMVRCRQYDRALELNRKMVARNNIPPEKDYVGILLEMILNLSTQKKDCKVSDSQNKSSNNYNELLKRLVHLLKHKEQSAAEVLIEDSLKKSGQECYDYLIFSLIEICYAKNNYSFDEPLAFLVRILRGTFEMSIDFFKKDFEECMKENDYEVAKLYIELIEAIVSHGHGDLPDVIIRDMIAQMSADYFRKKFDECIKMGGRNDAKYCIQQLKAILNRGCGDLTSDIIRRTIIEMEKKYDVKNFTNQPIGS